VSALVLTLPLSVVFIVAGGWQQSGCRGTPHIAFFVAYRWCRGARVIVFGRASRLMPVPRSRGCKRSKRGSMTVRLVIADDHRRRGHRFLVTLLVRLAVPLVFDDHRV
jgi:hypothetical protein